jgi:hypothetical protein
MQSPKRIRSQLQEKNKKKQRIETKSKEEKGKENALVKFLKEIILGTQKEEHDGEEERTMDKYDQYRLTDGMMSLQYNEEEKFIVKMFVSTSLLISLYPGEIPESTIPLLNWSSTLMGAYSKVKVPFELGLRTIVSKEFDCNEWSKAFSTPFMEPTKQKALNPETLWISKKSEYLNLRTNFQWKNNTQIHDLSLVIELVSENLKTGWNVTLCYTSDI